MKRQSKLVLAVLLSAFLVCPDETIADMVLDTTAELTGVWGGSFEDNPPGSRMGPMTQYSPDLLEDSLLSTSLTILGNDGIPGGTPGTTNYADYGAFMLLEFQTAVEAREVHLNILMRSFGWDYPIGPYSGMTADGSFHPNWSNYSHDIQTIDGFFDGSGNNFLIYGSGNTPTSKQWQTIDDIRLSDNRFQFLLWGPYVTGLMELGNQGIEVFEAHLTYQPVPVPSAVILGSIGLTFSGWLLRRRRML